MNYELDKGFNALTKKEQAKKRLEILNRIANEISAQAVAMIKYCYSWQDMTPAMLMRAAQSRDWTK